MCLEEIELLAQSVLTNLGLIFNISGEDLYGHFMSMRIFTLIMNKIFIRALKVMRKVATTLIRVC